MKLEEIDKNLKLETNINETDLKFVSVKQQPFDLYGFCKAEGFARIPMNVAEKVNEGVKALSTNTAGGRVRFKTDSPYIALYVKFPFMTKFSHMPLTGILGFDMYVKNDKEYAYECTFIPPCDAKNSFESIHYFKTEGMRDITINFPLYNDVSEVYIGISEKSAIEHGDKYRNKKPVVYYGSSITQGGCASRPGNSYQAIISRQFDYDYINLGFSGSARGEDAITEYIASLEMSCFVMDYDHNAPDYKHLKKTHLPMYKKIREKHPNIDIILLSMPYCNCLIDIPERKKVIRETYDYAVSNGDTHIYFIDGQGMFDIFGGDSGTVDGIHPNDLGFLCMAKALSDVMKNLKIE